MKILISGGLKTQNIVDGLERKFGESGIEFIVIPFIEDIESIYAKGEYFDRALIIEQCWNRDFEITDEIVVRNKINKFAQLASMRDNTGKSYIFLTRDEMTADLVYEEILPLHKDATIVVKPPKYTVSFFASLVTDDVDKFPEDIIYKIKTELGEESVDMDFEIDEDDYEEDYEVRTDISLEEDLFNTEDFSINGFEKIDTGFIGETHEEEIQIDNEEDGGAFEDAFGRFQDEQITPDQNIPESSGGLGEFDNLDMDDDLYEVGDFGRVGTGAELGFGGTDDWGDNLDVGNQNIEGDTQMGSGELGQFDTDNFGNDEGDGEEDIYNISYEDTPIDIEGNKLLFDDSDYENTQTDSMNISDMYDTPGFDDNDYEEDVQPNREAQKGQDRQYQRIEMSSDELRVNLDAFANRGNSIVVTGAGGCGTSLIAYNLANTIVNLGYTCLLVDLDVKGRTQSYIAKDSYDSLDLDNAGLVAAINSRSAANAHISIIRQGFHLLTMGLTSDVKPIEELLRKERLTRFANSVKTTHHFVVYDMPFDVATDFAEDISFNADNIALIVDSSNWGITKTMLAVGNIASDEMQDNMFHRAQFVFNKYKGLNKVFGRKVRSALDITRAMDRKMLELIGEDVGYYFANMHIAGVINDDNIVEQSWYANKPYSETPAGQKIFTDLLCNIVLKR